MSELSVFISYAREDSEAAVRLYKELRENGLEPWLDVESLRGGQKWKVAIKHAIKSSRYFLALLSSQSVSKVGYVNKEMSEALEVLELFPESEVYLIPARLDKCQPTHEKLSELHWVDMFPSWETGVTQIVNAISKDVQFRETRLADAVETPPDLTRPTITPRDNLNIGHTARSSFYSPALPHKENRDLRQLDPASYTADIGLREAVNVALSSRQPLLVTGEPGVGKTQLAYSMAYDLGLHQPLVYHVKSTSTASDLFYNYDAAMRLHDLQVRAEKVSAENYLSFGPLGIAILLSLSPATADPYLPISLQGTGPRQSVVLIDSIDKAPRDLPNDIFDEVEEMAFKVKEIGQTFVADEAYMPVLIFTSNSEKHLPDAFLSRCVYYQIPFPDSHHLQAIVRNQFGTLPSLTEQMLNNAIRHFLAIRQLGLRKIPSLPEFFAWLHFLANNNLDVGTLKSNEIGTVTASYSLLAKTGEDMMVLRAFLDEQFHS